MNCDSVVPTYGCDYRPASQYVPMDWRIFEICPCLCNDAWVENNHPAHWNDFKTKSINDVMNAFSTDAVVYVWDAENYAMSKLLTLSGNAF